MPGSAEVTAKMGIQRIGGAESMRLQYDVKDKKPAPESGLFDVMPAIT
jgi:hypothetical protein